MFTCLQCHTFLLPSPGTCDFCREKAPNPPQTHDVAPGPPISPEPAPEYHANLTNPWRCLWGCGRKVEGPMKKCRECTTKYYEMMATLEEEGVV